jgi:protoporphyrinogen/coproporphyrinogen III oxidase
MYNESELTGPGLRVAIVGGGIAGLAAKEALTACGQSVELFEACDAPGGRIAPAMLGEREVCLGGKNIGANYAHLRKLLALRGYQSFERFGPDTAQLRKGRVCALSFESRSMRARMGVRLLMRGQVKQGRHFLGLTSQVRRHDPSRFLGDEFFADLAARTGDPALPTWLGTVLCRDVVRHITVRMNGAEPEECHLGNLGSNLALVVDRFDQLSGGGLGEWIREVAAEGVKHLKSPVAALVVEGNRVAGVVTNDGKPHRGFDGVVLAVPAHGAAKVVWGCNRELASLLGTIRYFPVGVVVAEYDRPVFPGRFAAISGPDGISLSNAGSYGLRDRHIVRFTFSGAAARASVVPGRFDPDAMLGEAHTFLAHHLPMQEARLLRSTARAFEPGLCAYRRDHATFLGQIDAMLTSLPGLALAGDYMRGASLEACTRSGQEAAGRIVATITDARRRPGDTNALAVAR